MKKKIIVILVSLLILFMVYNIIWLMNLRKYVGFEKKIGYSEYYGGYSVEKEGYVFHVCRPTYLSFTGNLAVTKNRHFSEEEQTQEYIDLIVWPTIGGGYQMGVMICKESIVEITESSVKSETESIDLEFDKEGNLLPEYAHLEKEYLSYKNAIDDLIKMCEDVWGIDLPN